LTTTRANAQLVCWFTVISPHRPDFGTPDVAIRRHFAFGGAVLVSVVVVTGRAAAGALVELLELRFEPPATARR
jgi:hypothetical protein